MLSPSIRQVFHALLTRPPLTCKSLGFSTGPFDLHVLSTPPAFILSQDQTLMLKFCLIPCTSKTGCFYPSHLSMHLLLKVLFWIILYASLFDAFSLEFSGLHYCLFVKVLIDLLLALFAATYLIYHKFLHLSSTFYIFLKYFVTIHPCRTATSFSNFCHCLLIYFPATNVILPRHSAYVNNKFLFSTFLFFLSYNSAPSQFIKLMHI